MNAEEYQVSRLTVNRGRSGSRDDVIESTAQRRPARYGVYSVEAAPPVVSDSLDIEPANSGARPLSELLAEHQINPAAIPQLARTAAVTVLGFACREFGGIEPESVTLIWFDRRAAKNTLGLFSLLADARPAIWLSDVLADDAIQAGVTMIHEVAHYHQYLYPDPEGDKATDEREADELARSFQKKRRLIGNSHSMIVGWA